MWSKIKYTRVLDVLDISNKLPSIRRLCTGNQSRNKKKMSIRVRCCCYAPTVLRLIVRAYPFSWPPVYATMETRLPAIMKKANKNTFNYYVVYLFIYLFFLVSRPGNYYGYGICRMYVCACFQLLERPFVIAIYRNHDLS